MLETRREPPHPPLAGNAFPHPPRLSLSLLSSIPFVFLPLFSIYSSFLTPSFFFLISYRIKAIKTLCICTYLFVFSKPKNSTSKGVGRKGVLVRGRFFIFYFLLKCNLCILADTHAGNKGYLTLNGNQRNKVGSCILFCISL